MTRYFYIDSEGNQKGPLTLDELRVEPIRKEQLVWTQGMTDWKPAYDIADLKPLFEESENTIHHQHQTTTPPPPHQTAAGNVPLMPKTWIVESILEIGRASCRERV